jgi:hypothetical protein
MQAHFLLTELHSVFGNAALHCALSSQAPSIAVATKILKYDFVNVVYLIRFLSYTEIENKS